MADLLAIVLMLADTALLVDALRRRNALIRPEFYLLLSLYAYGIPGYINFRYIPIANAPFLLSYSHTTELVALFYTTLAIAAVYAGGRLYAPLVMERNYPHLRRFILAGFTGIAVGIILNYTFLIEIGAFSADFQHATFIKAQATAFHLPYLYLLIPAFAMVALYSRRSRYVWMAFALFAIPNLMTGSRRATLIILIAIFVGRMMRGVKIKKRWVLPILLVALVLGVGIGATRGRATLGQVVSNERLLFYPLTEFSRSYGSLLYFIKNPEQVFPGETYLHGLVNTLPRSLRPLRVVSPGVKFSNGLAQRVDTGGAGQGFSPVAEVLNNFTAVGIPLFFFLVGALIRVFSRAMRKGRWALYSIVLCAIMYGIGRGGFYNQIAFLIWSAVFSWGLLVWAGSFRGSVAKTVGFSRRRIYDRN